MMIRKGIKIFEYLILFLLRTIYESEGEKDIIHERKCWYSSKHTNDE